MPIDSKNHPEFPHVTETLVFNAINALVMADQPLVDYYGASNIEAVESEEIRKLAAVKTSCLWTSIVRARRESTRTGLEGDGFTTIEFLFISPIGKYNNTQESLLWRLIGYVMTFIKQNEVLFHTVASVPYPITDGVVEIDTTEAVEVEANVYSFSITATFTSSIDETTGLPIGVPVE